MVCLGVFFLFVCSVKLIVWVLVCSVDVFVYIHNYKTDFDLRTKLIQFWENLLVYIFYGIGKYAI